MADKSKRLRKILLKHALKGVLIPVNTLEEALIVIIDEKPAPIFSRVDAYKQWIDKGNTFPEESIHHLTTSNPRDRRRMEHRFHTVSFFHSK